jgi:hypothetical protein
VYLIVEHNHGLCPVLHLGCLKCWRRAQRPLGSACFPPVCLFSQSALGQILSLLYSGCYCSPDRWLASISTPPPAQLWPPGFTDLSPHWLDSKEMLTRPPIKPVLCAISLMLPTFSSLSFSFFVFIRLFHESRGIMNQKACGLILLSGSSSLLTLSLSIKLIFSLLKFTNVNLIKSGQSSQLANQIWWFKLTFKQTKNVQNVMPRNSYGYILSRWLKIIETCFVNSINFVP